MELTNSTGLPGYLFRTAIDDTRMGAALIGRVTYRIEPDARLALAPEQPWILSAAPWDGPAGKMPSDQVFHRGGVDLFVFGHAWAPGQRPVKVLWVKLAISNGFECQLAAVGDRVWTRSGGRLIASAPKPFVSIPLALQQAYGGKDTWDGLAIPFPINPDGKGFYVSAEQAVDRPLPNLEDPAHPIHNWNDQPDPVGMGLCPLGYGPHLRETVRFDEQGRMVELRPRFFNHAFPKMIAPAVKPGDTVVVEGVSPEGPLRFRVPNLPLKMQLQVGKSKLDAPLAIDQIGIEADLRRVFITYRFPFRYTLRPREVRTCEMLRSQDAI